MTTSSTCSTCNTTGLPILPVRYTVVPAGIKTVKPKMPKGITGTGVKNILLDPAQYEYALRTMRTGFMYLFYKKGVRGANYWEVYSIAAGGEMFLQVDPASAVAIPEANCARAGHKSVRTTYICIQEPALCETVWIAFSEHKWSAETVNEYAGKEVERAKRMQAIEPKQWLTSPVHAHAVEATVDAMEHVLEYSPGLPVAALAGGEPGVLSLENGAFVGTRLRQQTSRYPVAMRNIARTPLIPESANTAKAMHQSGKRADKKSNPPMMLALWDAVGTVHELNSYRNEIAGRFEQYRTERAVQLDAINLINNIQGELMKDAGDRQAAYHEQVRKAGTAGWDEKASAEAKAQAQTLREPKRSEQLARIARYDQDAKDGIPSYHAASRERAMMLSEPQRSIELKKAQANINQFIVNRNKNAEANIDRARADAVEDWPKYRKRLDMEAAGGFATKAKVLEEMVSTILNERTTELVKWLEAPLFIAALEDYHPTNIADGVQFEDNITHATMGISSSISGVKKIDAWVKECKAGKNNLVWRTIALNQKASIDDVNALLAEAKKNHAQNVLASSIDLAALFGKIGKGFADVYKKAQSISNANAAASVINEKTNLGPSVFGHRIKPVKNTGDQFIVTHGERILRFFRFVPLADGAAEHIISHMLNVRAFVTPGDSLKLLKTTAVSNGVARADILKQMRLARTAGALPPSAHGEAVKQAWKDFKASNAKAPSAIRDARLAVVVLLFESVNFLKMGNDCRVKNDAKSYAFLLASGMSIASLLLDVVSVPVKEVLTANSWSYQRIKLMGGVLSAGSALIIAGFDLESAIKESEKGEIALGRLYAMKAGLGAISGTATLLTAATYAGPLIERLTGKVATGLVVRTAGTWAAEIIAARIIMMTLGCYITVAVTVLQIVIFYLTPDELEEWCSHCAFGKLRAEMSNAGTVESQRTALALALKAVQ